jgi:hypothetical protein
MYKYNNLAIKITIDIWLGGYAAFATFSIVYYWAQSYATIFSLEKKKVSIYLLKATDSKM